MGLQLNDNVEAFDAELGIKVTGKVIQGGFYYTEYPFQVLTDFEQDKRVPDSYTSISVQGTSRTKNMIWKKVG